PAGLRREIDDHRAGAHRGDGARGDQPGGGPARDERGRDHDVELGKTLLELLPLLTLLFFRELLRVPAFRFLADDAEVEPVRAEALDLLSHDWTHVEAGDDGPEPARGRDRLEAGNPCAEDEHLRGRDRP